MILKKLFPDNRRIGCYFHYSYKLSKKLKEYNLYTEKFIKISEDLLKELFQIPLKIPKDKKENWSRYDSFTLIYYFIIKDIINCKEIPNNLNIQIEFYKKFIENISNSGKTILDKSIWRFIDNLIDNPYKFKKNMIQTRI